MEFFFFFDVGEINLIYSEGNKLLIQGGLFGAKWKIDEREIQNDQRSCETPLQTARSQARLYGRAEVNVGARHLEDEKLPTGQNPCLNRKVWEGVGGMVVGGWWLGDHSRPLLASGCKRWGSADYFIFFPVLTFALEPFALQECRSAVIPFKKKRKLLPNKLEAATKKKDTQQ